MKKLLFTLACCLLLSGCGSSPTRSSSITISDLPGDISYEDMKVSLSAVSFCEVYAAHGYNGYCVVTVDRSALSDDEVYWMLNKDVGEIQAELEANVYLTSEANSLDGKRLSPLDTTYDSENIYFTFYTKTVQREHFDDFELNLQIITSPEKSLSADTTQYYYYHLSAEEGVDYSDYDHVLTDKEKEVLIDGLNTKIESLK